MAIQIVLLGLTLLMTELAYFRIARKLVIIDRPNERSSHDNPTIRGGGIIFWVAALGWFANQNFKWPFFIVGLSAVALISFMDDLKPRPALWRFLIHLAGVLLMFYQVPLLDWPWWLMALALLVCIGALSAFNFMDGINGITGIYSVVTLGSFAWINRYVTCFTDESLLFVMIVSVVIFLFFNFRKKAACFAGDVGSITIAFVQIFFLLQLIHKTDNFYWVIIFLVYGLDSVITIVYRIKKRENIFKPHRTHLYQLLSNELKWPHQTVSLCYGAVQLILNAVIIWAFEGSAFWQVWIAIILVAIGYAMARTVAVKKVRAL